MIRQTSFSEIEEQAKTKKTRRSLFLDQMNEIVPWQELVDLIKPFYPKGSRRPVTELERMIRIHFLQQWFNLADEACEDTIIETPIFRQFLGINLIDDSVPDETVILNFRHLLEKHHLAPKILDTVNAILNAHGLILRTGTIVDATIISAPSSTKNKEGARDPEMHSTKKGAQCYFGMKAHIGVDAATGLVHSVAVTPANEADVSTAEQCLHGEEEFVFGDAGYTGIEKREEHKDRKVDWHIGKRRSAVREGWQKIEQMKASVRAKVEHIFGIIKCRFGYRKVRYRGLKKNRGQVLVLMALANLVKAKKYLLVTEDYCVQN